MDADRTLEKLKEMLGSDNADAQLLIYSSNISNRPGTHSVVPYRLERIGKTSNFNLKVYDSRAPGKNTHVILFDSLANTWTDETGSIGEQDLQVVF